MVAISTLDIFHSFREKKFFLLYFFILFLQRQASKRSIEESFSDEEREEKGGKNESIFPDHPLCLISLEFYTWVKVRERENTNDSMRI